MNKYCKYKFSVIQSLAPDISVPQESRADAYNQGYQDAIKNTKQAYITLECKLQEKLSQHLEKYERIDFYINNIISTVLSEILLTTYPLIAKSFKQDNLLYTIRESIQEFLEVEKVKIYVNPADIQFLENIFPKIELIINNDIQVGDCLITNGAKNMELTIEKYILNIKNSLEKVILKIIASYKKNQE